VGYYRGMLQALGPQIAGTGVLEVMISGGICSSQNVPSWWGRGFCKKLRSWRLSLLLLDKSTLNFHFFL